VADPRLGTRIVLAWPLNSPTSVASLILLRPTREPRPTKLGTAAQLLTSHFSQGNELISSPSLRT
jgi:hypothetical protein